MKGAIEAMKKMADQSVSALILALRS
jgi:hypothetical protein